MVLKLKGHNLCKVVGLRFQEIQKVDAWHDSVRLFSVTDLTSNELLGYFFLDLFSRYNSSSNVFLLVSLWNQKFVSKLICTRYSSLQRREVQPNVCFGLARWMPVV